MQSHVHSIDESRCGRAFTSPRLALLFTIHRHAYIRDRYVGRRLKSLHDNPRRWHLMQRREKERKRGEREGETDAEQYMRARFARVPLTLEKLTFGLISLCNYSPEISPAREIYAPAKHTADMLPRYCKLLRLGVDSVATPLVSRNVAAPFTPCVMYRTPLTDRINPAV